MKRLLNDLLQLIFPRLCISCESRLVGGKKFLCARCLGKIPRSRYSFKRDNILEVMFAGRFPFERIASYAYFNKKGIMQKLVHELKYGSNPKLGEFLGSLMARDLEESGFASDIDCIVPVPLHPKRLKTRGYNQSGEMAKGISRILGTEVVADNLLRVVNNVSQTNLNQSERWRNVEGIFAVQDPQRFEGKHILLLDDILTTGATLESCARELLAVSGTRLSVYVLGSGS